MQPGIHDGLSNEQYHASDGISKSGLALFDQCPARFRYGPPIRSRSLALGTLAHCAILEPDDLERRFAISDLRAFNPDHKAYQAELRAALGRELVKRADYEAALRMRDAVMRNSVARELITPELIVERSFAWHDPGTGILCRGRADGINPTFGVMMDVKTTKDASAGSFGRDAHNYRYHWQHPMYADGIAIADGGWTPDAFVFLCVENEAPWLTAAYEIEPKAVTLGRAEVADALLRYKLAIQQNRWEGLPQGVQPLALPRYAY